MIPMGIKPVGLNKRAQDILKHGQSVKIIKLIFTDTNYTLCEIYDGESYIVRDLDFPLGMSHLSAKNEVELRHELKEVSEIGRRLMKNGDLKLGIEWKTVISKTGTGKYELTKPKIQTDIVCFRFFLNLECMNNL